MADSPEYPFSERARTVLALARADAERRGHVAASPLHIALGMLDEGGSVACDVLSSHHIPVADLRRELEAHLPPGPAHAASRNLPWTPAARAMLERAIAEARELKRSYVGTEHLLLALLHDSQNVPATVLAGRGLRRDSARAETLRLLAR
jgi:ATP-dependent Clp protease ATP-binding subunit ClpC